jgi:hypothetical protein
MCCFSRIIFAILALVFLVPLHTEASETEELYLSGTGSDNTVPWEFFCTGGRNSGVWTTIPVPSCWELKGFGTYNYGHDANPASEQGLYRHSFQVPAEWAGRNIQLVFEGSMTDTEVTVNGVSAGSIHQGAFYQFRFNVSGLLNYGQANLLEVTVSKRSSNSSINEAERAADYWIFGGIFRPVRLEARPAQSLQRVAIAAQADGALSVVAHANAIGEALTVHSWVENAQGQQVGDAFSSPIQTGETSRTLVTQIPAVTPWTMEAPVLYYLVTELRRGGETLHRLRERFGFRTVEVRPGDGLYLNGVKIRVKGVNRHVFHPDYGRTSSRTLSEEAVGLIKKLNMNAVRMSHYPPDSHMLEVCDEQGLLVIDELTGWQSPSYDTPTAQRLVREMVERDVNHPSIILWANGNEGGWNTAVDGDFALYDPQVRTVIHPSTNFGGNIAQGGIDTTHYPNYPTLLNKLNGPNLYMPTEFLHGLYDGGHGAGLQDYWNAMRNSPRGVGGFLWVFADEGVRRTDQNGRIDNDGNHAADGIVGPYNEKKPSYNAVREIWSPVVLTAPTVTAQWNGAVQVLNDYYFTNLNQCLVRWELGNFPKLQDAAAGLQVRASGEFAAPSLAPQATGTLQIPLPGNWHNHDALRLTLINREGQELRQWTWPTRTQAEIAAANVPVAPGTAATATEDANSITLTGGPVQVVLSKTTGHISGVIAHGQAVALTNGPRIVSGTSTLTGITRTASGNDQVVTATHTGNLNSVTYRMRGDGWMRIDYTLNITGNQPNIGVTFDYPENLVTSMRWFGGGPQPVWKNRLAGAMPSVWEKTANNPVPGQSYTFDPIFRGYHRDLRWAALKTTEARIQIVPETSDLFFRVLTPANGVGPMNTLFTMPPGNLSLLHGISAIGNKFDTTDNLGPMSATNVGQGSYSGSFWLSFADVEPEVSSVQVASPYRIQVVFSRPMSATALDPANYDIPGILVHGVTAGTGNSVLLDVQPLEADVSHTLEIAPLTGATGKLLSGPRTFPIVYQPRLELHLPFDSLAAGSSPDISDKNRHATVGNNATLVAARRSQGLQFNGTSTSRATVSLPSMSGFTVEAWVKLANAGPSAFPRLISMANENVQVFFDYSGGASNGSIGVNVKGRSDWRSAANVLPAFNTWFHVAVAYDSTATAPSIYLNGVPLAIASTAASAGTYGSEGDAVIGNRASDGLRGISGIIDEFRVHSRPLVSAELSLSAAIPSTQSFETWIAARGHSGGAASGDADGNGVSDLVDYFSANSVGASEPLGLLPISDDRLGFYFRVGKSVERVNWHVETSADLSTGNWVPVSGIDIHPWRDLGTATEYLAIPPETHDPKLFARLIVTQE